MPEEKEFTPETEELEVPPEKQEAELLTDEITEIISYRPHWIIRRGPAIFFLVLVGLASLSWFIRYPDTVRAPLRMNGVNTPKLLLSKVDGKLVKLLQPDQAIVKKGQALAYMESTADHQDVEKLRSWIESVEGDVLDGNIEVILGKKPDNYTQLGELQPAWQEFVSAYNQTLTVLSNGYYQQKKNTLYRELGQIGQLAENTRRQQEILQQDFELAKREYQANESLFREKVVAQIEFDKEKSKIFSKQQQLEQMRTQLINNASSSISKRQELLDLQKIVVEQRNSFQNALFSLKNKLADWVQRYTIIATENGKLQYIGFLQENQHIRSGQDIFYVVPDNSTYYGEVAIGQVGFGKLKKGQRVIVKFDSYPYTEFGSVEGFVTYISNIPVRDSSFMVKVDFPKGLSTNYGKKLFFTNNMTATAEIVTDDLRLTEKLLYQFRNLMSR